MITKKPHRKRYFDEVISLWKINKKEINTFIKLVNNYYVYQ